MCYERAQGRPAKIAGARHPGRRILPGSSVRAVPAHEQLCRTASFSVDNGGLTEFLSQPLGVIAFDAENEQARLGWPRAVVADPLACIRHEAAVRDGLLELALPRSILLVAEPSG